VSGGFVTVHGTLKERRVTSVRIDRSDLSAPVWLPRAALHCQSNNAIYDAEIDGEIELQVRGSMAASKGLI
jgi:hypothetical protein